MRRLVALALALSACGPSLSEVRRAKTVGYDAPFAVVWNVMTDEIHKRYTQFKIEDPVKGQIRTDWRMVEAKESGQLVAGDNKSAEVQMVEGGIFMRTELNISGGPPWFIKVESEAAEFVPNLVKFIPIKPGSNAEPAYVRERTERLTVDIYRRLARYAALPKTPADVHKRVYDDAPWANLPRPAGELVAAVRKAAADKDAVALRAAMDPAFTWSRGAPASAEAALTMWNADPSLLRLLVSTLDRGCAADAAGLAVTCPVGASPDAPGPVAGFKSNSGVWRFVYFLAQ